MGTEGLPLDEMGPALGPFVDQAVRPRSRAAEDVSASTSGGVSGNTCPGRSARSATTACTPRGTPSCDSSVRGSCCSTTTTTRPSPSSSRPPRGRGSGPPPGAAQPAAATGPTASSSWPAVWCASRGRHRDLTTNGARSRKGGARAMSGQRPAVSGQPGAKRGTKPASASPRWSGRRSPRRYACRSVTALAVATVSSSTKTSSPAWASRGPRPPRTWTPATARWNRSGAPATPPREGDLV